MAPSSWPWQEPYRFNLNDGGVPVADLNQPSMIPISIHPDGGNPDSTVVVTCFKSMTWVIENKNSTSAGKVAVINLKLQDYGKNPAGEKEVQFRLTRVTLEPMSMTYQSAALCTSQQSCCHQFEASRYKDNFWRNGGQVSGFQRYTRLHVDINGLHPEVHSDAKYIIESYFICFAVAFAKASKPITVSKFSLYERWHQRLRSDDVR
ncbi:hypothetical protein ACFX13_028893 [Malus domestica]